MNFQICGRNYAAPQLPNAGTQTVTFKSTPAGNPVHTSKVTAATGAITGRHLMSASANFKVFACLQKGLETAALHQVTYVAMLCAMTM